MEWDFYLDSHTLDTSPRLSNDGVLMIVLDCFGESMIRQSNDKLPQRFVLNSCQALRVFSKHSRVSRIHRAVIFIDIMQFVV